ncbi:hypothetical protein [Brevibacillus sp. SYSU BS000544]|uniref:hypothetical protein n=1 Tax=Brevibacillus sp. SYSU BS000544 TaxID=3416443 RepID=UPI003CE5A55F
MAITFYMLLKDSEDITKLKSEEDAVHFDEEVYDFLCRNNPIRLGEITLPLLGLDPYGGEEIFYTEEIKEFIKICEILKNEYAEVEVHNFSNQLIQLCTRALASKRNIATLGD